MNQDHNMGLLPRSLAGFALGILLVSLPAPASAEDAVIGHGTSSLSQLSDDQVKDLFLGRKTTWEDGTKVTIVIPKDGPVLDRLMARLGKNDQQFMTGWKKLVFTGKASMPEQVADEAAVVALVAKTPGAIGYADSAKAADGAKVISIK